MRFKSIHYELSQTLADHKLNHSIIHCINNQTIPLVLLSNLNQFNLWPEKSKKHVIKNLLFSWPKIYPHLTYINESFNKHILDINIKPLKLTSFGKLLLSSTIDKNPL